MDILLKPLFKLCMPAVASVQMTDVFLNSLLDFRTTICFHLLCSDLTVDKTLPIAL